MSIASKEARESNYWLRLLDKSDYLNNYPDKLVLFNMSQSIVKLLTSIIKTSREKNKYFTFGTKYSNPPSNIQN